MHQSGFGFFWPIVFIAFIIFVIVMIVSKSHEKPDDESDSSNEETALTILKKRYAKGEITKKEFMEMKKDIA